MTAKAKLQEAYLAGIRDGASRLAAELGDAQAELFRLRRREDTMADLAVAVLRLDMSGGVSRDEWARICAIARSVSR